MEVFFWGLPQHCSEKRFTKFLKVKFEAFGIKSHEFICEKSRKTTMANATILDWSKGIAFVQAHQQRGSLFLDKHFFCKQSDRPLDELKLRSLRKKAKDTKIRPIANPPSLDSKRYTVGYVACGVWAYELDKLCFLQQYATFSAIDVFFGKKELVLLQSLSSSSEHGPQKDGLLQRRIGIPYSSIYNLALRHDQPNLLTMTLDRAPKFYDIIMPLGLEQLFQRLSPSKSNPGEPKRIRTSVMDAGHANCVESCFVYQISLAPEQLEKVKKMLRKNKHLPSIIRSQFSRSSPKISFIATFMSLKQVLKSCDLQFPVKFQLQRLAQNSYLLPETVESLVLPVVALQKKIGLERCVLKLQHLSRHLPVAGPEAQSSYFSIKYLQEYLSEAGDEEDVADELSVFEIVRKHPHLVLVHRARITPTGTYLEGPFAEAKNGVLERYHSYALDHFLRVAFEDENGEQLKFEPGASVERIHEQRYKGVMRNGIHIAGKVFQFLGFSHSSLRDSACWFMSSFTMEDDTMMTGRRLISQLGDFSQIRSPAKCGARIGQAFTDLNDNVYVPRTAVVRLPDVERNGRCFSDGCSTASLAIFEKLWKHMRPGVFKPTTFQIRYGGVKGVISLDRSLKGEILHIRPSQEKFPSDTELLGICGAARRALPLYLNRPMIKILEDLGVTTDTFLSLQSEAIQRLKKMTSSARNAATFAEIHDIGRAVSLPWLILELQYLGIEPLEDHFLWSAIELIVILRLRDMKYKGRIPIAQDGGSTLFGIMDETNTLGPGEIYCTIIEEDTGRQKVITGTVAVTRSPAMHPGDVQPARAVDVAGDHPFKDLHNVVIFSQQGPRDLPSMLSGGDLDGDLFNIIVAPRLLPTRYFQPASYARVKPIDLGRQVEPADISNFFVDFMANDGLGQIATKHLQLADQSPRGTLDPDCLKLAEMHSTAVDFSKTGIKVDMSGCPKISRCKPDFMASGPRMLMQQGKPIIEVDPDTGFYDREEDDVLEDLELDAPKTHFYESNKALGHLFRAIDERQFLLDIQGGKRSGKAASQCALPKLWMQVQTKTQAILWQHLKPWALGIKEQYEYHVEDLMYQYALDPHNPLTELEVFVGIVMGKDGGIPSKRARDAASSIREQYNDLVQYTVECILKGEEEEVTEEALERSIACFRVALEGDEQLDSESKTPRFQSFGYLAATVCLRQVQRFAKDAF